MAAVGSCVYEEKQFPPILQLEISLKLAKNPLSGIPMLVQARTSWIVAKEVLDGLYQV